MHRTKASFSHLQLLEFEKEASEGSNVFTNHGYDVTAIGFARNMVFFQVNGASTAEKSWLECATVSGVIALAWNLARTRAQWNWWFQVISSLL